MQSATRDMSGNISTQAELEAESDADELLIDRIIEPIDPDGYCGLKGTGISCSIGGNVVVPAHRGFGCSKHASF